MRVNLLTICMVLAELLLSTYRAEAIVITSNDSPLVSQQRMSHRAIIYQDLSRSPVNWSSLLPREILTTPHSNKYIPLENTNKYMPLGNNKFLARAAKIIPHQLTGLPLHIFQPDTISVPPLPNTSIQGEGLNNNASDIAINSFIDSLKNDLSLRVKYLSSKDLIFSYRKKTANILQLDFNMKPNDYRNNRRSWANTFHETELPLTIKEQGNLQQRAGILFRLISQSYKNIFYTLLALSAALYICFRYFLNKYI